MHPSQTTRYRRYLLAGAGLALAAAVSLFTVQPADADPKHGKGWKKHKKGHKVVVVHRAPRYRAVHRHVVAAPVYQRRYVTYRPNRVVVVQPAPYVAIGGRIGPVDISAVFGPRAQYSSAYYGCNFCEARYSSYGGYASHVQGCGHRPDDYRVVAHPWGDDRYAQAPYDDGCNDGHVAWEGDQGY